MPPLSHRVPELFQNFPKASSCLLLIGLLEGLAHINVQQLDLLCYVVHGLLKVRLLPIGREVQRLEGGQGS